MIHDTYLPTLDEVRALANANQANAATGKRNRALVLLLASTGLRIGEALALKSSDFDFDAGTVRVQRGKTGQRVVAFCLPEAVDALGRWLDARKGLGHNGHLPIFCTLKGTGIQQAYIRRLLPRLAERAGIEGRIHAHGLRHFFAATAARAGVPMFDVQRSLGHSSLNTTAIYLARIAPEESLEAMREGWAKLLEEEVQTCET